MNIEMIRLLGRWTALLAILYVVGVAIIPNLLLTIGHPDVQLPGGPRDTEGVSNNLNTSFGLLGNAERQHFVAQFSRELTSAEINGFSSRLGIVLDGPIPENAYITSTVAALWPAVRDALQGGTPPAVKLLHFEPHDKLAPSLRDENDPTILNIPPFALFGTSSVAIYVRFFDDAPLTEQQVILSDRGATQPDGSPAVRGRTGLWAVVVPETELLELAAQDQVRFIEPTMPPVVEDMDQARIEVGAGSTDANGAGVVIAQWEKCQPTTSHDDMQGRIQPIGDISFICREWQFDDKSGDDDYAVGEPIGVDLDEDGSIDHILHPAATPITAGGSWKPLPRRITQTGKLYIKGPAGNLDKVQLGDTALTLDVAAKIVTPTSLITSPVDIDLYSFSAARHPTLVAGIMISSGESIMVGGEPKYPGMAPAATVRSHAWHHTTPVAEYTDAIANGAQISSNSFGWGWEDYPFGLGADPYNTVSQFYDEVVSGRRQSGAPSALPGRMLVVASAGNQGDHSDFWSTARIVNSTKNVIAVGNISSSQSTSPGTDLGVPAYNSGRGPTMDGRLTPVLSAPGTQYQCVPLGPGLGWECGPEGDGGITSTMPGDMYSAASGTSFSTPIVSGAAALLSQKYEDVCGAPPSPQNLRALLVHSTKDLVRAKNLLQVPLGTKLVGPDFVFGYGLVQVDDAIEMVRQAVTDEIETGWVEHRVLLDNNDQLVDTLSGPQLRVTLVWDDPPYYREYPPRQSTGILQNDLDLEIIDPFGNRHLPWTLDATPGNEASPAKRKTRAPLQYVLQKWRDHRNTIEQVVVDVTPQMMNRTFTIRVREHAIRRGPQSYTLVSEIFRTLPFTDCGEYSNGNTISIAAPLDVPDTPFAWALFWIAVIILVWLTYEAAVWMYETVQANYPPYYAYLAVLLLLLVLLILFRVLVAQNMAAIASFMLVALAYVWWRATQP